MALFTDLRAAVFLKRIALALERSATAHEALARVASDEWERQHGKPRPSKVEFGIMDPSEVDKLYAARQEKEALGEYEDEAVETE